jgi:hypothetical protein
VGRGAGGQVVTPKGRHVPGVPLTTQTHPIG